MIICLTWCYSDGDGIVARDGGIEAVGERRRRFVAKRVELGQLAERPGAKRRARHQAHGDVTTGSRVMTSQQMSQSRLKTSEKMNE